MSKCPNNAAHFVKPVRTQSMAYNYCTVCKEDVDFLAKQKLLVVPIDTTDILSTAEAQKMVKSIKAGLATMATEPEEFTVDIFPEESWEDSEEEYA